MVDPQPKQVHLLLGHHIIRFLHHGKLMFICLAFSLMIQKLIILELHLIDPLWPYFKVADDKANAKIVIRKF